MDFLFPLNSDALTINASWSRLFKAKLKQSCSLTVPQYLVLDYLERNERLARASAIAHSLGITPGAITFVCDKLISKELIERIEDTVDRRSIFIKLTDKGSKLALYSNEVEQRLSEEIMYPLGRYLKSGAKAGALSILHTYGFKEKTQTYSVAHSILGASILDEQRISKEAKEFGLSYTGFRILLRLFEEEEGMSASSLAMELLLKLTDITSACNSLFEKELVARRRGELDRRMILIELTSSGYSLLMELAPKADAILFEGAQYVDENIRLTFQKGCRLMAEELRKGFRPDR